MQKIHYKSEQDSVRQRLFFFFHSGAHRSPLSFHRWIVFSPPLAPEVWQMASGARKERDIKEEEGGGRKEKAEDIYPVWKEKKRHGNRIFWRVEGRFFIENTKSACYACLSYLFLQKNSFVLCMSNKQNAMT